MRLLTKRKYLATWYVNVDDVDPSQVYKYLDAFKSAIARGAGSPWYELEVFLEAPVLGYFIPVRGSDTRIEVQEITFRTEDYNEEASKNSSNTL